MKPVRVKVCLTKPLGAWVLPAAKSVSEANGLSEDKTMYNKPPKGKTRQQDYYKKKPYGTAKDHRAVIQTNRYLMYGSNHESLFQSDPLKYRQSSFKPKGWTDTVESFLNEAKKEATLLLRNRQLQGHRYRWDVGINFEIDQTAKEISETWAKVGRKLNLAGVVAYRILEITTDGNGCPTNRVHYHLIVKSDHTKADLEQIIDQTIPTGIPYHKHVKPIDNEWGFILYILKARVEGWNKAGRWVKDKYADERILFRPNLNIKKVAKVGEFWANKSKATIWSEIKDKQGRIGENLQRPEVARLVKFIHEDFFGRQIARKEIERSIGLHADVEGIRQWAGRVSAA